ncbi:MAG: creatininase family protein [Ignavibacteriales bacterium]|nr:creatininase family protein [Ignavibacteriales bacterium]
MPSRPYILAETNWKTVKPSHYDVAVLPWGATEAHNYHLPYGTDIFESDHVAAESAKLAWEQGARVIVLPTVPFGVNTGQLDIHLTINMNPSTQAAVLNDVVDSLSRQGITKLVVLNSHGGNDFKQMIRELQLHYPNMFLCAINWYQVIRQEPFFKERDDHAGEMETSVMLNIAPELVRPLSEAGSGAERKFKLRALRERWAWTPRQWTKSTADTGIGNPAYATAEKGKKYLAEVTKTIGAFFVELASANIQELYE